MVLLIILLLVHYSYSSSTTTAATTLHCLSSYWMPTIIIIKINNIKSERFVQTLVENVFGGIFEMMIVGQFL